jgi:hypothetical protein
MRTVTLPLPKFGFVVATRAALAAGVGLLVADHLSSRRRRRVGLGLIAFGAAATIPAIEWIRRSFRAQSTPSGVETDSRLTGATRLPRKGDDVIRRDRIDRDS